MDRMTKRYSNFIIYNRDNYALGLSNHFDNDGELDSNYTLLRNVALTGKIINGKFISDNKKHFDWLKQCATTRSSGLYGSKCWVCSSIFEDADNGNFNIKPFYMKNVVTISSDKVKVISDDKPISEFDDLAKNVTKNKSYEDNTHPLFKEIMEKFNGRIE